ncbi:rhodanese-like domain-containing protein [Natronomonas sp. LN261]|jgi:rhodanese-related sulfurtransferase|uniref:rhodanese-like domain-containing protein n=1 Tax=Natronomonas sp. LN261 TaxID=2750669 RepID=UPI0015EEB736|nr:rhodanese-like domain-containing protein [Natronomonas sp. LN261]
MDGEITADELKELLDSGTPPRIVDIRSPGQFRREHIPGSENIPFAELTARIEELSDADRVVTVCPHGKSSVQAARLIASFEGFEGRVESLDPGLRGWPYEVETGEPSTATPGETPDTPF